MRLPCTCHERMARCVDEESEEAVSMSASKVDMPDAIDEQAADEVMTRCQACRSDRDSLVGPMCNVLVLCSEIPW